MLRLARLSFLACVLVTAACQRHAGDGALNPKEFSSFLLSAKDVQLVDVRTREEYAEGHLKDARLIPVQEFERRIGELDPMKPLALYCRSGNRSGVALALARDKGFKDVRHLAGGIKAWQAAGMAVEK